MVDEVGLEELPDRRRPSTETDVESVGERRRERQRIDGGQVAEEERRLTDHQVRSFMVGQDDDRCVERRFLAPPSPPALVLPRAELRTELPTAHDLDADAVIG